MNSVIDCIAAKVTTSSITIADSIDADFANEFNCVGVRTMISLAVASYTVITEVYCLITRPSYQS